MGRLVALLKQLLGGLTTLAKTSLSQFFSLPGNTQDATGAVDTPRISWKET
jgi:hypothetical protein